MQEVTYASEPACLEETDLSSPRFFSQPPMPAGTLCADQPWAGHAPKEEGLAHWWLSSIKASARDQEVFSEPCHGTFLSQRSLDLRKTLQQHDLSDR